MDTIKIFTRKNVFVLHVESDITHFLSTAVSNTIESKRFIPSKYSSYSIFSNILLKGTNYNF